MDKKFIIDTLKSHQSVLEPEIQANIMQIIIDLETKAVSRIKIRKRNQNLIFSINKNLIRLEKTTLDVMESSNIIAKKITSFSIEAEDPETIKDFKEEYIGDLLFDIKSYPKFLSQLLK